MTKRNAKPVVELPEQPASVQPVTVPSTAAIVLIDAVQMRELSDVIEAEAGDVGYGMVDTEFCRPLLDAGFLLVNAAIQENGLTAAKLTQAGLDYWQANKPAQAVDTAPVVVQTATNTVKQPAKEKPMFEIHDNFTPPVAQKATRSGRTDTYPFDKLAVGQSFFVPATEAKPEPHKSMLSTVQQAMGRYAVPTGKTKTLKSGATAPIKQRVRVFGLYEHTHGDVKGAMIMRHPDAAAGTVETATE